MIAERMDSVGSTADAIYTSKYSANYVLGVCRCLLVWAPLAEWHLTCGNGLAGRWLDSALRGDPAGGLRADPHTKPPCLVVVRRGVRGTTGTAS
jgi:hypothetical protein